MGVPMRRWDRGRRGWGLIPPPRPLGVHWPVRPSQHARAQPPSPEGPKAGPAPSASGIWGASRDLDLAAGPQRLLMSLLPHQPVLGLGWR